MGSPTYDYSEETVIVTGSSSGIGRATAIKFADAGAFVICGDVQEEPKDKGATTPTHELIREAGGIATFVDTDVPNADDVRAVVERATADGGVDVMINNAGIVGGGTILETDPTLLDQLHGVNVRGVYVGTQVAANDMIDRGVGGVILNTASIASNFAQGGSSAYEATKGAVRMVTRGAAFELADHGIRVNAAAPGQIATEIADGWTETAEERAQEDSHLKPVPLGRAGRPQEVADAFLFLASDAASYITGELIHVDGGWQIC